MKKAFIFVIFTVVFQVSDATVSLENSSLPLIDYEIIDWPTTLSQSNDGTLWSGSDLCFCLNKRHGLLKNPQSKTYFFEKVPSEISSRGIASTIVTIIQATKTHTISKVSLTDKGMGEIKHKERKHVWVYYLVMVLLILFHIGIYVYNRLHRTKYKKDTIIYLIFTLLLPMLYIICFLCILGPSDGIVSVPLIIDNATGMDYVITINGDPINIPSKCNVSTHIRNTSHTIEFKKNSSTPQRFLLDLNHANSKNTYIINIDNANHYSVKIVTYMNEMFNDKYRFNR